MSTDSADLKDAGNALFRERKFEDAYAKYGEALEATTDATARAVLFSNRAQCCITLKRWQDAKMDATEALCADQSHHKAWLRLRRAYVGQRNFAEAIQLYEFAADVTQDSALASALRAASRGARKEQVKVGYGGDKPEVGPPTPEAMSRAVALKEAANALVSSQQPDLNAAYAKFSLAIAFDPTSAIVYCNRAFVANSLKQWDTAIANARKSISYDKAFVKAWARLGAAHLGKRELRESEDAFKHGLQLLANKAQPLSPADSRLKASIEQSLHELARETRVIEGNRSDGRDTPWILADRIISLTFNPAVPATWYSSAWVILQAATDFSKGCQALYSLQVAGPAVKGPTATIQFLTNALTCDARAFYVDRDDFFEKYKQQVMHEYGASNAFSAEGAQPLLEAVNARLRAAGGWGDFHTRTAPRKALATTVRAWFLSAFLRETLVRDYDESLRLYKHAVDFIELGRQEWSTTPREQRGAIFELTFLLGIERNYVECLRRRYISMLRMDIPDTAGILEQLKSVSDKMLAQCATFSPADRVPDAGERKPSFILPFIIYPEAMAHGSLGFYYYEKAKLSRPFDMPTIMACLRQSADHYAKAAELYPKDDELRTQVLFEQLTSMFRSGRPLRETLPICDELAQSVKDKQRIWRASAYSDNGRTDERYMSFVTFAQDVKKARAKGDLTLDQSIIPEVLEQMG